jgi:hypothetical protein
MEKHTNASIARRGLRCTLRRSGISISRKTRRLEDGCWGMDLIMGCGLRSQIRWLGMGGGGCFGGMVSLFVEAG